MVAGLGTGHDQAVTAVVAVQRLVVVDGTGVLGPELHLVEMELGGLEVTLGQVHQIWMDGETIEVPRAVRELLDPGELARLVARVLFGVVEVVLGLREVEPERISGRRELLSTQEALHEREAALAHLGEGGVGDPHREAP